MPHDGRAPETTRARARHQHCPPSTSGAVVGPTPAKLARHPPSLQDHGNSPVSRRARHYRVEQGVPVRSGPSNLDRGWNPRAHTSRRQFHASPHLRAAPGARRDRHPAPGKLAGNRRPQATAPLRTNQLRPAAACVMGGERQDIIEILGSELG
jgi:hypothetical protein